MSNKKGFTLIELLIVIVIIGILSVAVVPRVLDYPKKARDASRKQTLTALQTSMASYLIDSSSVPGAITAVNACLNDGSGNLGSLLKNRLPNSALPIDPKAEINKYGQGAGCPNYYYVLDKDANGVVKGYGFMAAMETNSGNVAPASNFNVAAILNLNPISTTGTYYLLKQTGL